MSKTRTIKAKKLKDGTLVEVLPSGKTRSFPVDQTDWAALDAMTDEEVHAAALADPDAQPLTEEQLAQAKRLAPVKRLRMKLHLTQEQFSKRYGIPLTTLRDWEQYRTQPDQASQSYIKVIDAFPDAIAMALGKRRQPEHA
jgi:putative transcriptional regulator